jgi:hypothetical protein
MEAAAMTGQHLTLTLLALGGLIAAGYVHLRLADFTATLRKRTTTSIVLIVVGIAIGLLGGRMFRDPALAMLAFVFGFGVVHLPAACILLLKRLRGEGRS